MGPCMRRDRSCLFAAALLITAYPVTPSIAEDTAAAAWTRIEPRAVRIGDRTYEPTCSQAEGADPAYAFWYRKGTTDSLVVYFDGGGAIRCGHRTHGRFIAVLDVAVDHVEVALVDR